MNFPWLSILPTKIFSKSVKPLDKIRMKLLTRKSAFKDLVQTLDSYSSIEPKKWRCGWNVHSQAIGSGEQTLKYLARYVFRVGISDKRILQVSDTHVTIAYKKAGSNRKRRMTLTIFEFIRRFLQHILPSGFMKIRHYGFMSANSKISTDELREL